MGLNLIQLFFQKRLALLLSIVLVALLSWQLVHWVKVLRQPRHERAPVAAQFLNPQAMASQIGTRKIFGVDSEVVASPQGVTSLNLKLNGVFAEDDTRPSVAIISVDGKSGLPFKTGDTVAPNVTLDQVMSDHVILSRSGVKEKLPLESKSPLLVIPVTASDRIMFKRPASSLR